MLRDTNTGYTEFRREGAEGHREKRIFGNFTALDKLLTKKNPRLFRTREILYTLYLILDT